MKNQILVFDMDGVLVDVTASYRATIARTVEHFTGKSVTNERIQDYKNEGGWNNDWALSQRILHDLGHDVDYDTVVEQFNKFFFGNGSDGLIYREQWLPEAGLLERLSERYDLAVFTGRLRMEARITLERFAAHLTFDPWVCTDDVVRAKPHPEGLEKIRALAPERKMCYLGDTVDDARSAKQARVPFIGVAAASSPRYGALRRLLEEEGAIAVIENINELESVLPK